MRWVVSAALVGLLPVFACAVLLQRVEGHYFDSDGVRLHYTDEGDGEAVVLLHGITLDIDTQWRWPGMIDALRPRYRVIALDQRGHGWSDKPEHPELYGGHMVEDVVRLLDHLGIERTHVVGYSLGALVARKLATEHPDRVLSAVPTAMGWLEPGGPVIPSADMNALAGHLERDDYAPFVASIGDVGGALPSPLVWVLAAAMSWRNDGAALGAVMRGLDGLSIPEERLRANRVPTLTLMGDLDPLLPRTEGLGAVPHHETRIVEGFGHDLYPRWTGYEATVVDFLARHPG